MHKRLIIRLAGPKGEQMTCDIPPHTWVRDVLNALGLRDHELVPPEGGPFGLSDDLYDVVSDGQILYAVGVLRGC
jgi:hypothetical protein